VIYLALALEKIMNAIVIYMVRFGDGSNVED